MDGAGRRGDNCAITFEQIRDGQRRGPRTTQVQRERRHAAQRTKGQYQKARERG